MVTWRGERELEREKKKLTPELQWPITPCRDGVQQTRRGCPV
jgi:hypothetical protein